MDPNTFNILALGMRYFFVLIILYILFRVIENAMAEYRFNRRFRGEAGGYSSFIECTDAPEESYIGQVYGIKRENVIGSKKQCDVCLPFAGVSKTHAVIFQKGDKLLIYDSGSFAGTYINGEKISGTTQLYDGDYINFGEICFYLQLTEAQGEG